MTFEEEHGMTSEEFDESLTKDKEECIYPMTYEEFREYQLEHCFLGNLYERLETGWDDLKEEYAEIEARGEGVQNPNHTGYVHALYGDILKLEFVASGEAEDFLRFGYSWECSYYLQRKTGSCKYGCEKFTEESLRMNGCGGIDLAW